MSNLMWQKIWRRGISALRRRLGLLRPCDRPQRIYRTTAEFITEQQTTRAAAHLAQVADLDLGYIPLSDSHTIHRSVLPQGLTATIPQPFLDEQWHTSPPTFVATIPQGRVWGIHGTVITPTNGLLADVSVEHCSLPEQHPILRQQYLPSPHHLRGTAVALSAAGGDTYFHWMMDVLPRLALLHQAGIALTSIDHFIVNSYYLPFQRQTLAAFGISANQVVENRLYPHLIADRLIVPALPGWTGNPPLWVCEFLQQQLRPRLSMKQRDDRPLPPAPLIYVSRARTRKRRLSNERQVQQYLLQQGFQVVYLETLTVAEQAELFAAARTVVAPHGAGLTNLVFCQPKTAVIELFPPNYIKACYWALSNQVGLDYYYLVGEQVHGETFIDVQALTQILQFVG